MFKLNKIHCHPIRKILSSCFSQNKQLFYATSYRFSSQIESDKSSEILKKVISSHVAYKIAFLQLLESIHTCQNVGSNQLPRRMKLLQQTHLNELQNTLTEYRAPPPFVPLTTASFALFGLGTTILNSQSRDELASQLSRLVENHSDFCLFQMNENNILEPELRKIIIRMRDEAFEVSQEGLSSASKESACVGNIADWIFSPILRQHFGLYRSENN